MKNASRIIEIFMIIFANLFGTNVNSDESAEKFIKNSGLFNVISDIFATIDAINRANAEDGELVIGYRLDQYSIMTCLLPFIRPAKIAAVGNVGLLRSHDFMVPYTNFVSTGTVLTPDAFIRTQLKLLRIINIKAASVPNPVPVTREVMLFGTDASEIPYFDGESVRVADYSENVYLFPVSVPIMEKEEYTRDAGVDSRHMDDCLTRIAKAVGEAARDGSRGASA